MSSPVLADASRSALSRYFAGSALPFGFATAMQPPVRAKEMSRQVVYTARISGLWFFDPPMRATSAS